jgi:C_GCAxxG_C_C family probable redox protein
MSFDPNLRARELFSNNGYYCAESVLLAVAEHAGIQDELIPRIATGFCSGISRTGGMCGAVSGGIMAIGLYLGRNSPNDNRDACYEIVRVFMARFSSQFGALSCFELTGVQLGTPEGQAAFKEKGLIKECTNYVGEATRMVVELVGKAKQEIMDISE